MQNANQGVHEATLNVAGIASKEIERRGRADIAAGGRFGSAWTSALNARVTDEGSKVSIDVTMGGAPPVSYWKVFEYGATIKAKNPSGLLWIPFDESNKEWPSEYSGGSLFRIPPKGSMSGGLPLLIDKDDREAKYFGKPSVTIPQKFHLREIIQQVADSLRQYFKIPR
jgi:hypothetical protein